VVEKFPTKKDFSIDLVEFSVDAGDRLHLTITWSPSDAMRCREMVIFRVDETYRLQTILLGNADQPQKPRKVSRNNHPFYPGPNYVQMILF
jgi:L-ribulose-5-phosphate 3-epimerase UlaE